VHRVHRVHGVQRVDGVRRAQSPRRCRRRCRRALRRFAADAVDVDRTREGATAGPVDARRQPRPATVGGCARGGAAVVVPPSARHRGALPSRSLHVPPRRPSRSRRGRRTYRRRVSIAVPRAPKGWLAFPQLPRALTADTTIVRTPVRFTPIGTMRSRDTVAAASILPSPVMTTLASRSPGVASPVSPATVVSRVKPPLSWYVSVAGLPSQLTKRLVELGNCCDPSTVTIF